MFSGLRSQWIILASFSNANVSNICAAKARTFSGGKPLYRLWPMRSYKLYESNSNTRHKCCLWENTWWRRRMWCLSSGSHCWLSYEANQHYVSIIFSSFPLFVPFSVSQSPCSFVFYRRFYSWLLWPRIVLLLRSFRIWLLGQTCLDLIDQSLYTYWLMISFCLQVTFIGLYTLLMVWVMSKYFIDFKYIIKIFIVISFVSARFAWLCQYTLWYLTFIKSETWVKITIGFLDMNCQWLNQASILYAQYV